MRELLLLPRGFRTAGTSCGIKDDPAVFDIALFVSDTGSSAAGVFTQNRICGAPVTISRDRVPSSSTRAVVINSGNANACTGDGGLKDARRMTVLAAEQIGCDENDVLVCSTGVIGHALPMEKIEAGIPAVAARLASTPEAFADAARGMMTTDTIHKQSVRQSKINGKTARVSGACKGAAMIGPNMATMLAVVMTDAELTPDDADRMLRHAVNDSFNCISVEGHTSTSDSVILLANGAADTGPLDDNAQNLVQEMIDDVCEALAKAIVRDAEGADHIITIEAVGLRTREEAHIIAKTVANDALVKTAIAGCDPNWGRIVSCCGRTGVELTDSDITLRINSTLIYEKGIPIEYDESALSESTRKNKDVTIELGFPFGSESLRFWTSDLTQEYVRLNSEYTT